MKQELDKLLCERYPKMMVNRDKSMMETCMCWGFECGNGWFDLLDQLMGNIQHHIDWKNKQRQWAIDHNAMAAQCKAGNFDMFEESMKDITNLEYKEKRLAEIVAGDFREVPPEFPQVTLDQVKEKFGTLRFYYTGGDEYISGMVAMAESMSGVICESCGNPGERKGGGWVRTICEPCEIKREEENAKRTAEYEALRQERERVKMMKDGGFEE
jgi:hypothetical protein